MDESLIQIDRELYAVILTYFYEGKIIAVQTKA